MRSRGALTALAAAAVLCMMLTGAPVRAHANMSAFGANPVGHGDTLIGTGTVPCRNAALKLFAQFRIRRHIVEKRLCHRPCRRPDRRF